jgi:molybdate transport system substrate-binding protein
MHRPTRWLLALFLLLTSCSGRSSFPSAAKLTVAAAANLSNVLNEVATAFTKKTGVEVTFSFGSTVQLAQQIENGAPFDVFAAADTEHVDQLINTGKLASDSRAIYARGQLALWIPRGQETGVRELQDLVGPEVRFIAIAQPELAPYGQAAVEALRAAGLWDKLQSKFVYANSISAAKQLAESGNADAAFTAYSLVLQESGVVL